ncbi:tripeptidyl-peptidase 2 [Aedes albopictus]|uniref:Peptidase S8/S53 domain-containing protein n=1 Tax=Aedes albopictus TaxID=7160 RepID=A0ABM1XNJ9_AEDAL
MECAVVEVKFPASSLVPKNENGALNFVRKYPEYNGKDVTIAILDSGVDPRAKGLEIVPGGDVKVGERFDCSGCGDGTILDLSGRVLRLSNAMKAKCPSGQYRVGLKSMHDLYSPRIREKIVADTKLKPWDEAHKKALAEVSPDVADFDAKNPNAHNLSLKEKLTKENLHGTVEFLNACEKKF